MNYIEGMRLVVEDVTVGGGVFGDVGDNGGNVGNVDFYATGDARNLWGVSEPKKKTNSKKKSSKKKKKKNAGFPLYKRAMIETLTAESMDDTELSCASLTKSKIQHEMFKTFLEKNDVKYEEFVEEGYLITEFINNDHYIQNVIDKYKQINTTNKITHVIGEFW